MLDLDPEVLSRLNGLLAWARRSGIRVTITSARRSTVKQAALYAAYLARGRRGLPAAPPGTSTHEYGYGIDLVVRPPELLNQFARAAECFGLKWAGKADPVHFDPFGFAGWRALLGGREPSIDYRC